MASSPRSPSPLPVFSTGIAEVESAGLKGWQVKEGLSSFPICQFHAVPNVLWSQVASSIILTKEVVWSIQGCMHGRTIVLATESFTPSLQ